MAGLEMTASTMGGFTAGGAAGDDLFQLGIKYSTGREVAADLIAAHKWFNLAALKGNRAAVDYRREIAGELTAAQIAAAQRDAREWVRAN